MLVHLFGGISSPSCASYALQRTADDNATKYDKETIYTIRNNFYVDDYLKSVETEDKALQLVDELRELLKKGGLNLTKWVSNSRKVIKAIPELTESMFSNGPGPRPLTNRKSSRPPMGRRKRSMSSNSKRQ
ncbi:hypothetical protein QZH41_005680 [Actinostola sp. cb2023]|nr:hypothetical protein QZH41_005680 [Actinostola sp. cb2023]